MPAYERLSLLYGYHVHSGPLDVRTPTYRVIYLAKIGARVYSVSKLCKHFIRNAYRKVHNRSSSGSKRLEWICTLRSGFYHLRSLHRLLIPRHALIISRMFLYSAQQDRVSHTLSVIRLSLTRRTKNRLGFLWRLPFINFLDTFYLCPDSL